MMSTTVLDLQRLVIDPSAAIAEGISRYERYLNDPNATIVNPTSPFVMSLEFAASLAAASTLESIAKHRRLYPSLANDMNELSRHISEYEMANMYAVPSTGTFMLYVNLVDLKLNGVSSADGNYVEATIPRYTEINILNTPFTLLNDIVVRYYKSGTVTAEQQISDDELATNELGMLRTYLVEDVNNIRWTCFELPVKQLRRITVDDTIIEGAGFVKTVPIETKYCNSNFWYFNQYTNGKYQKLPKSFQDEYIDIKNPTVGINITDTGIIFKINPYYIDNGITGGVKIVVYETIGKLTLPINNYQQDNLYQIVLSKEDPTLSKQAMQNINFRATSSLYPVDGGKNPSTFEELREQVIYNSTGELEQPITYKQLSSTGNNYGFSIRLVEDIVTGRLFSATKNMDSGVSNIIRARPDIYVNTVPFVLSDVSNSTYIHATDNEFVVKSGSVYREDNGILSLLTNDELAMIRRMPMEQLILYVSKYKYFYNPFYYIIGKKDGITLSRVYDLDFPVIEYTKITNTNTNTPVSVNIDKYDITKEPNGYKIAVTLIGNNEYANLPAGDIKAEMSIPLYGTGNTVSIPGTSINIGGVEAIEFILDSNMYVTDDDYIDITNGVSTVVDKYIALVTEATVIIYNKNGNGDSTRFLQQKIIADTVTSNTVVYTEQKLGIMLGKNLKHIWNRVYTTYTPRKYLTYNNNVLGYYKENVLKNGNTVIIKEVGGVLTPTVNYLHKKGDPILDVDGNHVFEHKKGDLILNADGKPVLNIDSGLVFNIDMTLLELEYKLANSVTHMTYYQYMLSTIKGWVLTSLAEINNKLLENTTVQYKPNRTSVPVGTYVNGVYHSVPQIAKPSVHLYTDKDMTALEIEQAVDICGNVIQAHLDKLTISLADIKRDILSAFGSGVLAVGITGIDNGMLNNAEVINIDAEKSRHMSVPKLLTTDPSGKLVVKYDIPIKISNTAV